MSDLIERLLKRAEIRRQIATRKSVQNNEPDRIADLLEEAAAKIKELTADRIASETNMIRLIEKKEASIKELEREPKGE